jgi:hypothetical protein
MSVTRFGKRPVSNITSQFANSSLGMQSIKGALRNYKEEEEKFPFLRCHCAIDFQDNNKRACMG